MSSAASSAALAKAASKFQNILVATDFSAASQAALPYACALAQLYGSTIHALYVAGPEPRFGPLGSPLPDIESQDRAGRAKLDRFMRPVAFRAVRYTTILRRGPVEEVISTLASELNAGLIVLGTHGRRGLKHFVLGSVAEAVFRRAKCPVMTVGPAARMGGLAKGKLDTIVYATDFSSASLAALDYALSLARTNFCRLLLYHSIASDTEALMDYPEQDISGLRQRLADLVGEDSEISHEVIVGCEPPADGILRLARETGADLIVMGAHRGASSSAHAPWAVVHNVVCYATCPVLTVRD
ncbi:MAG: universal stress protein [Terriglobales bacterium]